MKLQSVKQRFGIIGNSEKLNHALATAVRVASTDLSVLITGESGVGKEAISKVIHSNSARKHSTFIAINCGAIPEGTINSELFGHEKGAFTGAYSSSPGKFEQANGGTLLLDEISEMDIGLQAKLLRVIQEREVERLGARKTIALDVRILATTNRSLEQEVALGRFREDLFYRLSVFPLYWEPLRKRREDIVPLAKKLLHMHTTKMGRVVSEFDQSAINAMIQHQWPGNVRELDNVVQRALIMQPGTVISDVHLRIDLFQPPTVMSNPIGTIYNDSSGHHFKASIDSENARILGDDLQQREFEIIVETLRSERGSRKNTAEKLGISPRTLRYKLARMREVGINLDNALQGC